MKSRATKLQLKSETLRHLSGAALAEVYGGDLTSGQLGRESRPRASDPYFTDGCRTSPNPPTHGPSVWQPTKPLTDQPVPVPRPRPPTDFSIKTVLL